MIAQDTSLRVRVRESAKKTFLVGKRGKGLAAKKKNFFKALLRLEKKIPCVIELF